LSSSELADKGGTVFCRECGKSIEADARFCRFCGKAQADPVPGATAVRASTASRSDASGSGIEARLAQIFPRHHLQDEFMHIGSIAAFLMALIGFVVGFFFAYNWLGTNFLLGSIALLLFLILRESTLSHIRVRNGGSPSHTGGGTRYQAGRRSTSASEGPAEAANAESSPPPAPTNRPPATPR
jgi:zinc-ribbon domain